MKPSYPKTTLKTPHLLQKGPEKEYVYARLPDGNQKNPVFWGFLMGIRQLSATVITGVRAEIFAGR
jgi:hypothetical protein